MADRLISVVEDDASVRSAIVDLLVTRFRMRTLRSVTNIYGCALRAEGLSTSSLRSVNQVACSE